MFSSSIANSFTALSSLQYKDAVRHAQDIKCEWLLTIPKVRYELVPSWRAQPARPYEQHSRHGIFVWIRRDNHLGKAHPIHPIPKPANKPCQNDGPESHYIGNVWAESSDASVKYCEPQGNFPHTAWQPLVKSFISAYKAGGSMAPPSGATAIGSMWYKTILQSASCSGATEPNGWSTGSDSLNWAVVLPSGSSGMKVRATSNGAVISTVNVNPGLNFGSPTGVQAGAQLVELLDSSGKVVMSATGGSCVSSGCPAGIYNMNYVVVGLGTGSSSATCSWGWAKGVCKLWGTTACDMIYDCDEMHARSCMIGTNCVQGLGDCIMTRKCMLETGDLYKTRRRKKNCMHKRSKCHHEPRKNTKMTKETKKKELLEPQSFQLENHTTRPTPQILPRSTFLQTFNHSPARPVPHSLFINSAHDDSPLDLIPSFPLTPLRRTSPDHHHTYRLHRPKRRCAYCSVPPQLVQKRYML